MRPHPKHARTNPRKPAGWSTCQRSGFTFNQERLVWQNQWRGTQLMSINLQVGPPFLDVPQRQLGAFILEPDPLPLIDALPEPYPIDEYWPRLIQGGQPRYLQGGNARYLQISKYFDTN